MSVPCVPLPPDPHAHMGLCFLPSLLGLVRLTEFSNLMAEPHCFFPACSLLKESVNCLQFIVNKTTGYRMFVLVALVKPGLLCRMPAGRNSGRGNIEAINCPTASVLRRFVRW